ncbi:MAG: hypothetical protein Q8N18_21565 [Opitutaceae bacterium]|nr:hypothetical protein [Opitutaceae bacterium]
MKTSARLFSYHAAVGRSSAVVLALALILWWAVASVRAATISEADYEGRAHFKVETPGATYFYDRAGGGFSRLLDHDGKDWISFKKEPATGRAAAGAAFRGIPNLVFGKDNPDAGAGHPGFDQCESTVIASDAIRTVSKSGRWAWTWRFSDEHAVLTIEQADPERAYWFLYEGTVGGRWSPRTHYWGTNRGGPNRTMPFGKDKLFDRWGWAYFGDDAAPRVLVAGQVANDDPADTLWYMGNSTTELDAPDGMLVFGFGRDKDGPRLRGAGRRFVLGFVEEAVKDEPAHARVAATARRWLQAAESTVRVSETTLLGDMECFRIETPSATYLYGKRGAGFASIFDPQGRDWISYRHGGKSTGEYRGLPKSGQPVKYFHCGYGYASYKNENWFTSTVTLNEPGHVRIHSETKLGDAACDWDFYPTHATFTLLKIPGEKYWFVYEGTPGGALDTGEDFVLRPHGQRTPLGRPWAEAVPWVVFGAKESPHGLFLVNHQKNSADASYVPWPYTPSVQEPRPLMTVFGFGRPAWDDPNQHTPPLSGLPARYSIALTPAADTAAAEAALRRIGTPATDSRSGSLFAPPVIDVWQGDEQHFGRIGVPQKWINLLGRVSPGDGLASLQYSLNGAAPVRLSVGADRYRLARDGDFNVDLEFDALRVGANQLKLTATDAIGRRAERTVTVHCHRGKVWPLPYSVDFSKVRAITDAVQIVDGNWKLGPDGVRTAEPYYDRILAFGDRTWTDYTVTVAVTFHGYTPPRKGPPTYGVSHAALAARYPGHFADNNQPHVQWYPVGAVAEFRLGEDLAQSTWRIFHGGTAKKIATQAIEPQPRRIELGVKYHLKLRVDSLPGPAARYRVKSWKAAEPEPADWDFETTEDRNVLTAGGALFVAHNTDVTVGAIGATRNDPNER